MQTSALASTLNASIRKADERAGPVIPSDVEGSPRSTVVVEIDADRNRGSWLSLDKLGMTQHCVMTNKKQALACSHFACCATLVSNA